MFSNALRNTGTIQYEGATYDYIFRNVYPIFDSVARNYESEIYVIEGDTNPVNLAQLLYGNPEYYWVLLLLNEVVDPFFGWVLSDKNIYDIAISKWGEANIDDIHHLVDRDGNIYYDLVENNGVYYDVGDQFFEKPFYSDGPLLPVTNIEYLRDLNEEKREIEIIQPEEIERFVADIQKELAKNVG